MLWWLAPLIYLPTKILKGYWTTHKHLELYCLFFIVIIYIMLIVFFFVSLNYNIIKWFLKYNWAKIPVSNGPSRRGGLLNNNNNNTKKKWATSVSVNLSREKFQCSTIGISTKFESKWKILTFSRAVFYAVPNAKGQIPTGRTSNNTYKWV